MELGLGWLRAVAQGYSYSCNKIELGSNFQNKLRSCGVHEGWGLDGCARWRKVTVTVAIALKSSDSSACQTPDKASEQASNLL